MLIAVILLWSHVIEQSVLLTAVELQTKNREEIKRVNMELSRVDASAGRLQDVDRDIRSTVSATRFML